MPLRKSIAATLQLLRGIRNLEQKAFVADSASAQAHISNLEQGKWLPELNTVTRFCQVLEVEPLTFLTLAFAAQAGVKPGDLLERVVHELHDLGLINTIPEWSDKPGIHPRTLKAAALKTEIQRLAAEGKSRMEVARELDVSYTSVRRYWPLSQ